MTGRAILTGERFFTALRETLVGMERVDVGSESWAAFPRVGLLAHWSSVMPSPAEQKKKLFVDDEVLLTLFERLAETSEAMKLRFRFVLGLILMRKRLVIYEGQGDGIWLVRLKGRTDVLELSNPHLSEEQVAEVAGQLGEILSSEL